MSVIKTHKGAELNLQHYKGKSVVDFEFEMLDDDANALDLSIYSEIHLNVYAKRGGTLMSEFDLTDGLTVSDNIITWNAPKTWLDDYHVGIVYFHHCYGVISEDLSPSSPNAGQEDLLFYNNSEVI